MKSTKSNLIDFSKARNADHMNVKMEFTLRGGNKKIVGELPLRLVFH